LALGEGNGFSVTSSTESRVLTTAARLGYGTKRSGQYYILKDNPNYDPNLA